MLQAIKKQFQVQWKDWLATDGMIVGAGLIGVLLFQLLTRFDTDTASGLALGTLTGGIAAAIFILVVSTAQIAVCFNLQIAMGSTRKQFLGSWFVVEMTEAVAAAMLLTLFCFCEERLYLMWYPEMEADPDILPYLIRFGIPAAVAVAALGNFCGALILRYGKKAFWALWAAWMVLWIGFPRIMDAAEKAPGSFYGKIGGAVSRFFRMVPSNMWVLLMLLAAAAGMILTWGILRKQQVTG